MTTSSNDLSISELSLSNQTLEPFTLLATTEPEIHVEEPVAQESERHSAKAREEKLQGDIFILKKLNASFELFNEVLQDTDSANQVLLHLSIIHISLITGIFSALLLSSNKPMHFSTNMWPSCPDLKIILVLYSTRNGRGLRQYGLILLIPVHLSDYFRMRMPSKKKNGKLKKKHAARPKNKQFAPNKNEKDLNETSKIV